jgi:hydrogenase maturation protease
MKTLVLGLGNPILTDDAAGLRVARAVRERLNHPDVFIEEAGVGGLELLEILTGYDKAIIIDAIQTPGLKAGQIHKLDTSVLDATRHAATPHDINFATALELGKRLGIKLPKDITIFAIEVEDVTSFGEKCTPQVEKAVPICAEMVMRELDSG